MMEHIVLSLFDNKCLTLHQDEKLYLVNKDPTSAIQGVFVPLAGCYSPRCNPQQLCYAPLCPNKGGNLVFSDLQVHSDMVSGGTDEKFRY